MLKLVLLAAIVWLVFVILKKYKTGLERPQQPPADRVEDMVRCAQCGVHLPRSESVMSEGEFFCSQEHRRLRQG